MGVGGTWSGAMEHSIFVSREYTGLRVSNPSILLMCPPRSVLITS